jgi:hypothetical protein
LTTSPATVSNLRFPADEQHTSMFISGYMQIYISTKRVESCIIVTENKLGHRDTMFEGDCDNPPKSSDHVTYVSAYRLGISICVVVNYRYIAPSVMNRRISYR